MKRKKIVEIVMLVLLQLMEKNCSFVEGQCKDADHTEIGNNCYLDFPNVDGTTTCSSYDDAYTHINDFFEFQSIKSLLSINDAWIDIKGKIPLVIEIQSSIAVAMYKDSADNQFKLVYADKNEQYQFIYGKLEGGYWLSKGGYWLSKGGYWLSSTITYNKGSMNYKPHFTEDMQQFYQLFDDTSAVHSGVNSIITPDTLYWLNKAVANPLIYNSSYYNPTVEDKCARMTSTRGIEILDCSETSTLICSYDRTDCPDDNPYDEKTNTCNYTGVCPPSYYTYKDGCVKEINEEKARHAEDRCVWDGGIILDKTDSQLENMIKSVGITFHEKVWAGSRHYLWPNVTYDNYNKIQLKGDDCKVYNTNDKELHSLGCDEAIPSYCFIKPRGRCPEGYNAFLDYCFRLFSTDDTQKEISCQNNGGKIIDESDPNWQLNAFIWYINDYFKTRSNKSFCIIEDDICPDDFMYFKAECIKFINQPMTYDELQNECERLGADVLTHTEFNRFLLEELLVGYQYAWHKRNSSACYKLTVYSYTIAEVNCESEKLVGFCSTGMHFDYIVFNDKYLSLVKICTSMRVFSMMCENGSVFKKL